LLDLPKVLEIPDPPVLEIGQVQQNRFFHYAPVKNQTVRFGKPEHLGFLGNQFFLDLIGNMMLVAPNRSSLYFHPWKHDVQ
jgi:hypothetical protein